ncbi:hypothetical protein LZ32DRAFT_333120 [Colletotrichum eremochloae]|nr:hypothetical protein LZ32DRAFT_333120 [Colletotrichum eremochloae]
MEGSVGTTADLLPWIVVSVTYTSTTRHQSGRSLVAGWMALSGINVSGLDSNRGIGRGRVDQQEIWCSALETNESERKGSARWYRINAERALQLDQRRLRRRFAAGCSPEATIQMGHSTTRRHRSYACPRPEHRGNGAKSHITLGRGKPSTIENRMGWRISIGGCPFLI